MKRKVYRKYKTRKKGGQRYWVVTKRNYSSIPVKEAKIRTFYHGTAEDYDKSIKEKGLIPTRHKAEPGWIHTKPTLALTTLPIWASPYAKTGGENRYDRLSKQYQHKTGELGIPGGMFAVKPAIYKVNLPWSEIDEVHQDSDTRGLWGGIKGEDYVEQMKDTIYKDDTGKKIGVWHGQDPFPYEVYISKRIPPHKLKKLSEKELSKLERRGSKYPESEEQIGKAFREIIK